MLLIVVILFFVSRSTPWWKVLYKISPFLLTIIAAIPRPPSSPILGSVWFCELRFKEFTVWWHPWQKRLYLLHSRVSSVQALVTPTMGRLYWRNHQLSHGPLLTFSVSPRSLDLPLFPPLLLFLLRGDKECGSGALYWTEVPLFHFIFAPSLKLSFISP